MEFLIQSESDPNEASGSEYQYNDTDDSTESKQQFLG